VAQLWVQARPLAPLAAEVVTQALLAPLGFSMLIQFSSTWPLGYQATI
jgi:hypothetical protein